MADTKISAETDGGTLDGTEFIPMVRNTGGSPPTYVNRKTTTQAIANLTQGGLYDLSAGVPTLASMTAVNVSGTTSSSENSGRGFSIVDTGKNNTNLAGYRRTSVPSTPYRIALCILPVVYSSLSEVCVGWSDGTKYETIGFVAAGGNIETWNTTASRNGFTGLNNLGIGGSPVWIGLHDDGTNRIFELGADGANWITISSVAKASSWLGSSGHTQTFIGVRPADTTPSAITVVCYDEAGLSRVVR